MTADARRRCRRSDYRRLEMTATTAAVVVAAVVVTVAVAAARATTFESGETATVPPDDTVYMTEEVAAWNATAAAAGDYEYDDYDSTTAKALQTPGGRYSPKPAKTVASRVDASVAVPAATITVMVQVSTANVTNTTVADTTAVYSSASATTVVAAAADAATFPTTTTESGVLMQIASPPGYGATAVTTTPAPATTTAVTTTPAPTTPNSSAPLLQYRRWTAASLLSLALVAAVAL